MSKFLQRPRTKFWDAVMKRQNAYHRSSKENLKKMAREFLKNNKKPQSAK
jgi:hypothetical protein